MSYDDKFYANIAPGCQAAAAKLVPRLLDLFHPTSVIDIGCGDGWFLQEFLKYQPGLRHVGIDSHDRTLQIPNYVQCDIAELDTPRKFDLALCLEVAEHLPEEVGKELVGKLCCMSPVVMFSAAIPGQGGEGHVNEQWQDYWQVQFALHDFACYTFLRHQLWNDNSIPAWYRQNWLLFVRRDSPQNDIAMKAVIEYSGKQGFLRGESVVTVHPEIFRASERVVTVMVITDGRREYLEKTMHSAREYVHSPRNGHAIMIDDSGDPEYGRWLREMYPQFRIAHSITKLGFAGAIQQGWSMLPRDTEFVLHLEDDFTFNEPWDLRDTINILESHQYLAQVALRRQAVGHEVNFGGFVEQFPDSYTDMEWGGLHWFEHKRFFTTNPSLYPVRITQLGWPDAPHSEGKFGIERLFPAGYKTAFLGKKSDPPKVHHIGDIRNGTGY